MTELCPLPDVRFISVTCNGVRLRLALAGERGPLLLCLHGRLYLSPDSPRAALEITAPDHRAGGWIGRLGAALDLPAWLRREDLDYLVNEFTRAGFRGGLNYYRNLQRNWELMAAFPRRACRCRRCSSPGPKTW